MVASDYIRIINYYLKDVTDLHFLLSWEGISRIPFTFLARFINVKVFKYSVFFDKILGTFGLFLFNTVVVNFVLNNLKSKLVKIISSILITYISFSLMAWEMILNGTGYAHFITVGLIALTFKIFSNIVEANADTVGANADTVGADIIRQNIVANADNVGAKLASPLAKKPTTKKYILLCLLIIITSIIFAGSYAVSYNCTLILFTIIFLAYGIINDIILAKYTIVETIDSPTCKEDFEQAKWHKFIHRYTYGVKRKRIIKYYPQAFIIIIPIICLLLYFKSNNTGEALIPVGFKDISLIELLKTNPVFPIKFLLKSLASSIIGVETFDYAINFNTITERIIFLVGFIYLIVIIYAIILLIIKISKMLFCTCKNDEFVAENASKMSISLNGGIVGAKFANPCECCNNAGGISLLTFVSMFIVYGIANYLLVFLARYKFVVDSYGMTSRYSLQYMFLTIGIIILLLKLIDDIVVANANIVEADTDNVGAKFRSPSKGEHSIFIERVKKTFLILASILSLSFILLGHLTTNTDEIFKADYRKIIYSIVEDKAKNYKELSDDELENTFEYHRGTEQIREAFEILESQHLNIFKIN